MGTLLPIQVAMYEHKLRAERANRVDWMSDELARSHKGTTESGTRRLVVRVAGVAAALGALLLAVPAL